MSKLNALSSGVSAVAMGLTAMNQASINPFSALSISAMLGALVAAVFAGYCLASGEPVSDGEQGARSENE